MKCVLFDLDETLYDHRYSCQMAIHSVYKLYPGLGKKTVEELEIESWELLNKRYKDVLTGSITSEQARAERLSHMFTTCEMDVPHEKMDEISYFYKMEYEKSMRAVPGMVKVLEKLKHNNYAAAIITNGFKNVQMKKIKACNIEHLIDHIITSEEAGAAKPKKEIFLKALGMCGSSVHEAIMIGDAWESDICGALSLGIKAVWYNRRKVIKPSSEDVIVIHEPDELMSILGIS